MADTVIDPWAVMIHFKDAEAAFSAVMRSYWLPRLKADALLAIFVRFVFTLERGDHSFRNSAWVSESCSEMTHVSHKAKPIECHEVEETFHSQWDSLYELLIDQRLFVPVKYVSSIADVLSIDNK